MRARLAVAVADDELLVIATKPGRRLLFGVAAAILAAGAVVGLSADIGMLRGELAGVVWYGGVTLPSAVGAAWRRELRLRLRSELIDRTTLARTLWSRELRLPVEDLEAVAVRTLGPPQVSPGSSWRQRRDGRLSVRRTAGEELIVETAHDMRALHELGQAMAGYLGVPFEPSDD